MILKQTKKHYIITVSIFLLPVLLRLASTPTANLSFLLLAALAITGRAQAIQALAMSCLFTMISPGIAPEAPLGTVGRYIVILAAFIGIFARSGIFSRQLKASKMVTATIGLGVFFIMHSLLISPMPDVSILKAVSWLIVTTTLLSAWSGLTSEGKEKLFKQIYLGLVCVMLISLPLALLPLGYLRNGSGFQGILNHPQAFGPTMAIMGTIAASKLFAERKPSWQHLAVFGGSILCVIASEARTAGLAMVIGLLLAIISAPLLSGKRIPSALPGLKSRRVWCIASVALLLGVIFAPQLGDKFNHYISKSERAGSVESIAEAYEKSRGGLIDKIYSNIHENPLTGIGFGMASDPELMVVERDSLLGLPVGAAIEKGVMPLAIIEELGIIGAFLVFIWMFLLLKKAAISGVISVSLIGTIILLNMGESTFFSPGGLGMLSLIMFSWAASNQRRVKAKF